MTAAPSIAPAPQATDDPAAWRALFALAAGFFMIMIDTTIVSVSIPSIMSALGADVTQVIWVSSAYLLTYAIPLLITGRLGDRYGPKRLYLAGLVVFTATSFWCGMSHSISSLIAARAVQGLGAALMTPQTMAVITRMFPPHRRGAPMGLWGATASVAGLAGPLLGGLLVDSWGWEWIFFVNVPIGLVTIAAVWWLVPNLPTSEHSFDVPGVVLNAIGLTLLVVGIQEGQTHHWNGWIIASIVAGLAVLALFVVQQSRSRIEPLMPLDLFNSRNFSASNAAIFVMGALIVAMSFPLMLYLQSARGLSPTRAALVNLPSAVVSFVGAPIVGRMTNTRATRPFAVSGFAMLAAALFLGAWMMRPSVPVAWLLVPSALIGLASCNIWGPLSMSATRDLPRKWAGAGSGVYNATRQLGSVLGSALIAAIIQWQLSREMPGGSSGGTVSEGTHEQMPAFLVAPFSRAMSHAMWFPGLCAVVALVACLFLVQPTFLGQDTPADDQTPEAPHPAHAADASQVDDLPAGAVRPRRALPE